MLIVRKSFLIALKGDIERIASSFISLYSPSLLSQKELYSVLLAVLFGISILINYMCVCILLFLDFVFTFRHHLWASSCRWKFSSYSLFPSHSSNIIVTSQFLAKSWLHIYIIVIEWIHVTFEPSIVLVPFLYCTTFCFPGINSSHSGMIFCMPVLFQFVLYICLLVVLSKCFHTPDNLSVLFSSQLFPSWSSVSFSNLDWSHSRPLQSCLLGLQLPLPREFPLSPSWECFLDPKFFSFLAFFLCMFSSSFLNRYMFEYFKILVLGLPWQSSG